MEDHRNRSAGAVGEGGTGAPDHVGPYRIDGVLGRGHRTVVYAARSPEGERVALKLLDSSASLPRGERRELADRFRNEANLTAELRHPGIVAILASGEEAGRSYLVYERVEGTTLEARLAEGGPLPYAEGVELLRRAAEALAHAHAQGILHRDVKPSNLLLADSPGGARVVKLTDFGIAIRADEAPAERGRPPGSPAYMSPEQIRGEPLDERSDLFSLAGVAYRTLTGRPPFEGDGVDEVVHRVLYDDPVPPSRVRPDLPAGIDPALARGLAKERDRRPRSVLQFVETLAGASALPPPPPAETTQVRVRVEARPPALELGTTEAIVSGATGASRRVVVPGGRPGRPGPYLPWLVAGAGAILAGIAWWILK